jgi:hypothetical protein
MSNIRVAISKEKIIRKAISRKDVSQRPILEGDISVDFEGDLEGDIAQKPIQKPILEGDVAGNTPYMNGAEILQERRSATIHIFGNGETHIIGRKKRSKALSSSLNSLRNVVDNVISKNPINLDITADTEYRAINILVGKSATFLPKGRGEGKKAFTVKYSDLNQEFVQALIDEMPVRLEKSEGQIGGGEFMLGRTTNQDKDNVAVGGVTAKIKPSEEPKE